MGTPRKPSFDCALIGDLARAAEKAFANAEALYREAKLLGAAGAVARALFLHQISLEECAKIENIGGWATSLLAGLPVDQKKVVAGFASHARKNRTNAYMLEGSPKEQAAKANGDWKAALEEFQKLQNEFHEKSNDAKNASLYVDFKDGKFVAPVEQITDAMLTETAARNEEFLRLTCPNVRMLLKWEKEPEWAQEHAIAILDLLEATRDQKPDKAMAAVRELIDELVEVERAKASGKT